MQPECMTRSSWSWAAETTAGWLWPRLVTAVPQAKSAQRLPFTSVTHKPSARSAITSVSKAMTGAMMFSWRARRSLMVYLQRVTRRAGTVAWRRRDGGRPMERRTGPGGTASGATGPCSDPNVSMHARRRAVPSTAVRFPLMPTLRSRRVVVDGEVRPATIRHEGGSIVEVGDGPADVDFGDLVVLPGLVDGHVHVNEPGRAEWEGFATATRAAVAGGTTTIVDMPLNSIPPTVDVAALHQKRDAARPAVACDVAFWGGVVPGSEQHVDGLV